MKKFIGAMGLACIAAGCSADMSSVHYTNGAALPPNAIPYALPKTSITVTTTYALSACENDIGGKTIKMTINSAVSTTIVADDTMRFFIDYASMRGPMKDVGVTLDFYPQGTLKDLNATATNQTLQTAAAAAGAALSGVIAVSKAAIAAAGAPTYFCNPATQPIVDQLKAAQANLQKAKSALSADQTKLAGLAGGDPAAIKKEQDAVNADNAAVAAANDSVTTLQAKLTIVTVQKLTPMPADFAANANSVAYPIQTTPVQSTWLTQDGVDFLKDNPIDATRQQIQVTLGAPLASSSSSNIPPPDAKTGLSKAIDGLAVRFPVAAHIQVCAGPCGDPAALRIVTNQTAPETDVMMPQMGSVVVLALKGSVIQSSALGVSVATDGTVANVTTKDTSTLTQLFNTISSAFTSLSTQANSTTQAQAQALTAQNGALTAQTAASTAAASASDNALKAQADCLTQAKTILAAGAVPVAKCQ